MLILYIHIFAGGLSLAGAALALYAAKGSRLHVLAGRMFFAATVAIFLTASPLAIANNNLFLFLIAIFSFYLAFAGWRFARNVSGRPAAIDLLAVLLMLSSGLGMWALALIFYHTGDRQYVVLLLFGFIALALGITDLLSFQSGTVAGSKRLTRHLTNMLGATIAVITAFLVVNVDLGPSVPAWLIWVLPTAVITPYIVWWNIRLR